MRDAVLSKSLLLLVAVAVAASASPAPAHAKKGFGTAAKVGGFVGLKMLSRQSKAGEANNQDAHTSNAEAQPSSSATGAPVEGPTDEERAQRILAEEKRGVGKLHPLQTSEPGFSIVVCEAGCGDAKPHIIYKRPVAAVRSASAESATPSSPASNSIECRGGCPSDRATSIMGTKPNLLNDSAGSWMTTVTPDAPQAAVAPPANIPKPQASKVNREDWMTRINRERAANKAQQPAEPQTNSPSEVTVEEPGPIVEGNPIRE